MAVGNKTDFATGDIILQVTMSREYFFGGTRHFNVSGPEDPHRYRESSTPLLVLWRRVTCVYGVPREEHALLVSPNSSNDRSGGREKVRQGPRGLE